jgi:hypothetical protein
MADPGRSDRSETCFADREFSSFSAPRAAHLPSLEWVFLSKPECFLLHSLSRLNSEVFRKAIVAVSETLARRQVLRNSV